MGIYFFKYFPDTLTIVNAFKKWAYRSGSVSSHQIYRGHIRYIIITISPILLINSHTRYIFARFDFIWMHPYFRSRGSLDIYLFNYIYSKKEFFYVVCLIYMSVKSFVELLYTQFQFTKSAYFLFLFFLQLNVSFLKACLSYKWEENWE